MRTGSFLAAAGIAALVGFTSPAALAQQRGGEAVVAQPSAPPTLDPHITSAQTTLNIVLLVYEQLFTRDEHNQPIPDLAEGYEVSEDGLTYTIRLRSGVKFHDGTDFTAEDAKASLERYARIGGDKAILDPVERIDIVDDHTLRLALSKPVPPFIEHISFSGSMMAMMPAEQAASDDEPATPIGTGPFRFEAYEPDSHVTLTRFEDYVPNPAFDGPTGFGGRKTPYLDTVTFRFIPEAGGRVAALEAGEVQVVDEVDAPAAERLKSESGIAVHELMPLFMLTLWLNANEAPTSDVKVREAIQVAADMEEIMAIATNGVYQLDGAWQFPGTTYYNADAGAGYYNVHDVARAQQLLAESGYAGEPISVLADTNYFFHENGAIVLVEQLKAAGLNAELNLVDWPTALSVRLQPEGWNAWIVAMGVEPVAGPYSMASLFTGGDTWMKVPDPNLDDIYARLLSAETVDERKAIVTEWETYLYQNFYVIKLGNIGVFQATSDRLANFTPFRFPRMWDVWLTE